MIIDSNILKAVPQQPQVQCSAADQLMALLHLTYKFGLRKANTYMILRNLSQFSGLEMDQVINTAIVNAIPEQNPVDDATLVQELVASAFVATRFGLYDAAEVIRLYINQLPR